METYKDLFEKANTTILDCFTCTDGGIKYLKYLSIMRDFSEQADTGNTTSRELVEIVKKFSNLIDVLNR